MSSKSCPPSSVLADFAMGRLDMAGIDDVSRHLETCSRCAEALGTLQVRDSLLDAVRTPASGDDQSDPALSELISRLQSYAQTVDSEAENIPLSDRLACLRPAQSPDELGRLGRYRVLQVVGVGGMGTVFLAEDTQVEGSARPRTVALKVMRPGMSEGSKGRKRFLREVQALVAQDHHAILPVLDVGEDNGVPFFTMPLLRGESLDARLRRDKILPIEETIFIAHEIASGLAAAHERGVIHRDVKPANVFLCRSETQTSGAASFPRLIEATEATGGLTPNGTQFVSGPALAAGNSPVNVDPESPVASAKPLKVMTTSSVKLMDFGLARSVEQTSWQTQAGTVLGTPHYMAPEQIEGRDLDPRADLFSLGCVLFRMTTGTLPFTGPSHMSVFVAVTRDIPPNVRHLNPAVPPALAELIEQLLEKQPDRRPQSADDVVRRLDAIGHPFGVEGSDVESSSASLAEGDSDAIRAMPIARAIVMRRRIAARITAVCVVGALLVWSFRSAFERDRPLPPPKALTDQEPTATGVMPPTVAVAAPKLWTAGLRDENVLPGLVFQPATLPGVHRWQLETILPRGALHDLHWSPDGHWVAVANDRQLRIYEFTDGELRLRRILSDGTVIRWVTWSPDSDRVVANHSFDEHGKFGLRVWNVRTGQREHSAALPQGVNSQPAWSPDGRWLVAAGSPGSGVGTAFLYRMPELILDRELASLQGIGLNCVCWSPDSSTIATGSDSDAAIRLWRLDGISTSFPAAESGRVDSIQWSPDGQWIAAGIWSREFNGAQLISPTGAKGRSLPGAFGWVVAVVWSPDSRDLVVGSSDVLLWKQVQQVDQKSLRISAFLPNLQYRASWHPTGRSIVFGHHTDARLWWHDVELNSTKVALESQPIAFATAMSRRHDQLAFSTTDGRVRAQQQDGSFQVVHQLRPTADWLRDRPFENAIGIGSRLQWSASGKHLVSQHNLADSFLRVWNANDPAAPSRTIPVGIPPVEPRLQARSERVIVNVNGFREVDLTTGEFTQTWPAPNLAYRFSVSHDGELLAYSDAGKIKILRLSDSQIVHEMNDPGAYEFSWTADSRFLLLGCDHGHQLWDARTWQQLWSANFRSCYGIISPDRQRIATTLGFADAETGALRDQFRTPCYPYSWFADSQHLAAVTNAHAAILSATDVHIEQTIVPIAPDHTFVFDTAGNLRQGEPYLFDQEFIAIIERPDGSRDLVRPSELLRLAGMTQWPIGSLVISHPLDHQPSIKTELPPAPPNTENQPLDDTPPRAIAPFNLTDAQRHQSTWAQHLGIPVEYTNSIGMQFRLIPPGEYLMGASTSEFEELLPVIDTTDADNREIYHSILPQHRVVIPQPFYFGTHEVTQQQYQSITGRNPSHFSTSGVGNAAVASIDTANHPIENVSWKDAVAFCDQLGARERELVSDASNQPLPNVAAMSKTAYRLPTEAEWEFAARAGSPGRFSFGDSAAQVSEGSWFKENSDKRTHPVGQKKSNGFGLHDMEGNVREWCQDWWELTYYSQFSKKPAVKPTGPIYGTLKVYRGGYYGSATDGCRVAIRFREPPDKRGQYLGLRVVLPLSTELQPTRK